MVRGFLGVDAVAVPRYACGVVLLCVFGEGLEQLVVGLDPFDVRFALGPRAVS